MVKVLHQPFQMDRLLQHGVFGDFHDHSEDNPWSTLQADAAATVTNATGADNVGGALTLTCDTTDNTEAAVNFEFENFKFLDGSQIEYVARFSTTESTTTGNFAAGFTDAVAANLLQDDGAGAKTSHSGAMFLKVDSATSPESTNWQVHSSLGTAQTTTTTDVDMSADGEFETLMIRVEMTSATNARITFHIDTSGGHNWKQCKDTNGNLIQHTVTLTGSETEMTPFVYVKTGGAVSNSMIVDYIGMWQRRSLTDTTT